MVNDYKEIATEVPASICDVLRNGVVSDNVHIHIAYGRLPAFISFNNFFANHNF